jgi:hypothetical protein
MRIDSTGLMILAGPGIKFPATQVASADPNTLDDYEEGTWTPTVVGATTAGTATYTTQIGNYVKIGKQVTVSFSVSYTSGTGTGFLKVRGLPFTIDNTTNYAPLGAATFDNIATSALSFVCCQGLAGLADCKFTESVIGGGAVASTAYDAAGSLYGTFSYNV